MLEFINKLKEENKLEFIKSKGDIPNSLLESYSAFANSVGGTIILGIDEIQKNVYAPAKLSIDEVENLQKKFWDIINNKQKVSANILVDKDVYIDEYLGYSVLIINVRRARRCEKPIYINDNVFNGTYRRNHEGDYHCTRAEIQLMLNDAGNISSDKTLLEEFSIDDFDFSTIASYRQMLSAVNPGHVFLKMSNDEFYLSLGICKRDNDGNIHPTRAGLLMFGKEYRITDEFPHYFLDYQEHRQDFSIIRWTDRIQSSSGDWSGNVFDFFLKVYNKLVQDLPIPFVLDGVQRVDDTPMHQALREALCNTLSNADYFGTRGIVINKFKNRIEFSNPGTMRMGIEEAFHGGNSDPRNSTILKIFNLIKIGERAGTGFPTILSAVKRLGYDRPVIEESFNPDRTKLTIYLKKEIETAFKETVTSYGQASMDLLTKEQMLILEIFSEKYVINRVDVENKLGCGKTKAVECINSLINKGYIVKLNSGRSAKYIRK